MAEVLAFDATWLYDSQGHAKLCTTESEYALMMAQGWADSPAVFAIETHPTNPIQDVSMGDGAVRQQLGIPGAFAPAQNWEETVVVLDTMQHMIDAQAAMIATLTDRLELVEAQLTAPSEPTSAPKDTGGRK